MLEQDSMTPPSSPFMQNGTWGNEKIADALTSEFSQMHGEIYTNHTEDGNEIIFFTCQGDCNQNNIDGETNKESFLKRCHLERFLQGDLSYLKVDFDSHSTVELCNCQFTAPIALDEEMDELFYLARKKISKMELMHNSHGNLASGQELLQERISIRQFFNYILWFLKSFSEFSKEKEKVVRLIEHLKGILLHIGKLIDLPFGVNSNAVSKQGNNSKGPIIWFSTSSPMAVSVLKDFISFTTTSVNYHLIHLHLEVHWAILEILYYMSMKVPEYLNCSVISSHKQSHTVEVIEGDLLSQAVNILIWDIVDIALYRYKQTKPVELNEVSPFSCTCIKELLILLKHLLMKRQEQQAGESLVMIIQPVMLYILKLNTNSDEHMIIDEETEINSDVYQLPPEISCSDPAGFVWWFMAGIVPIMQFDINGQSLGERLNCTQTVGFGYILQQLARKSVTMPEVHLRNHMKFCIQISKRLEANTQILSIFWDQFYKKLNDTYSLTSNPLGHLQSIKKSASDLLIMSKQIAINDPKDIHSATSYVLFLYLLCLELQKSGKKGTANQEWKAMKGRLYSKFHSRRMQELSELGLQHFALLFLCLAEVADSQDVVQKLCDLYSTLNIATLPVKKRLAVWRGSFAVILFHIENNTDVLFLTDKMAASFNAVSNEISTTNIEPSKYSERWPLIDLYMESTQEIFEISEVLDLHQHLLINLGFQNLLKNCRENDLRKMLHFVEAVLTKHRILCRRQHVASNTYQSHTSQKHELNSALWKYFYTFVKEHACTLTPPQKLADLAAGFTLLALDFPPSFATGLREDFVSCFGYFAWNENVNSRISCRFLCHLLPNAEAMEQLVKKVPDLDKKLVQSWVKCSFELNPSEDEISEMTRLLLKIPSISTILSGNSLMSLDDGPPLLHFISAIGKKYSLLQDLRSKTEFRDKAGLYFAEVPKVLNVVLKNCSSEEGMCNIYNIAGHMVQDCSTLLYLKSKPDCLLPVLLDKLALPRAVVVQNKPLPPLVFTALKEHLHLFVKGLGRLDFRRDPYVQRKLKDIVINYMTKFPMDSTQFHATASSVHPLLMAVNNTFTRTVPEECSNFRRYFVDVIKSEYLALKGTSPPHHANTGWHFVLDLFSRTLNGSETAKDSLVLIKISLDYMLLIENVELKNSASKVMQYVVENLAKYPESVNLETVRTIIRNFFESNMKLYQGTKVLKVLDSIAVLFPGLLTPLVKVMSNAVKTSEAKRGVGVDKQLRMTYYNLLAKLGNEGIEEKSNLLRSTTL